MNLPVPGNATVVLRVAGEKYHDVAATLYRDGAVVGNATAVRVPESPDAQAAVLGTIGADGAAYSAVVVYTPADDPANGEAWGAPAWLFLDQGGNVTELHHTFNVRDNATWTWAASNLSASLRPSGAAFSVFIADPGSDDLALTWEFGDGAVDVRVYLNDPTIGPDPYPSPDVHPRAFVATAAHAYAAPGTYLVRLTVTDDDGDTTGVVGFVTIP